MASRAIAGLGGGVKFETAAAWMVWSNELVELVAKTKRTHIRTLSQNNTRTLTQCKQFPPVINLQSSCVSIRVNRFIDIVKSIFYSITIFRICIDLAF